MIITQDAHAVRIEFVKAILAGASELYSQTLATETLLTFIVKAAARPLSAADTARLRIYLVETISMVGRTAEEFEAKVAEISEIARNLAAPDGNLLLPMNFHPSGSQVQTVALTG